MLPYGNRNQDHLLVQVVASHKMSNLIYFSVMAIRTFLSHNYCDALISKFNLIGLSGS